MDGLSEPLRDALMSLGEGFRLAIVLCDLLGFDHSEAAEILGVQEGTIKSRIFRARALLAAQLRERGYPVPGDAPRGTTTAPSASHDRSRRRRNSAMTPPLNGHDDRPASHSPLGHVEEWESSAIDYLEARLSPRESSAIAEHLAACRSCREKLAEQKWMIQLLGAVEPVEVPRDLESRVFDRIFPVAAPATTSSMRPNQGLSAACSPAQPDGRGFPPPSPPSS